MNFPNRSNTSLVRRGIAAAGFAAGLLACYDDSVPLPGVPSTPVVRLLTEAAVVAIGDTARLVVEVTVNGEPRTPSVMVASANLDTATVMVSPR